MADVREGRRGTTAQPLETPVAGFDPTTEEEALKVEARLRRGVPTVDFNKGQPPSGPPGTQGPPTWGEVTVAPAEIAETSRAESPADRYRRRMMEPAPAPTGGGGGGGGLGIKSYTEEVGVTGAVPVDPNIRRQLEAADLYKARGAIGTAAANTGAARAEVENAAQRGEIQTQALQQQERMDQGRAKVVGARRKILEELNQDIIDDKIDPRRAWTEKSTGEKVFLGIMAGIAGIGVNLSGGGENPVLQNIRENIRMTNQEDLRRHQAKEKGYARQENALSGLVKIFDDERSALAALTSMKLTAIEQALIKRKAVAKTALERANLDTVIGGIAEANAKARLELDKLEYGKATEEQKTAYGARGGGGGAAKPKTDEPSAEDMKWVYDQYNKNGLAETEVSLRLIGEAMGMDGGEFAKVAAYNPGYLSNMLANASVKDRVKLQKAAAAFKIATHKFTGAALTADERADVMRGFDTSKPDTLATTASILGREFATRENHLESATPSAYQRFAFNREQALRGRPSVSVPTAAPESRGGRR